jgi:penicillin-binding protein 2
MFFDWWQFCASNADTPAVVDPRRRLRICLAGFVVLLLIVFGRVVQLELTGGAGFRAEALRPVEKETLLPAPRGRILARDGVPLACDQTTQAVAVQYRWLQDPPDARWLRATARARLAKADRKKAQKLAASQAAVLAERAELADRVARLCGLSPAQWAARTRQIQTRVEHVAARANRRRPSEPAGADEADESWAARIRRLLLEDPPPPRITVAEELAHHVVADDVPAAAAAEINQHADRYPGTKVVQLSRRTYPRGTLAAHVLGHLGPVDEKELAAQAGMSAPPEYLPDDLVGRMGVERQYEPALRGRRGLAVDHSDHSGHVLTSYHAADPVAGRDVTLTLDTALQRTAEDLLQSAAERRAVTGGTAEPAGGAIVVIDVRNGAIRAAASAPTFDPNLFARGKTEDRASLLANKTHPLFDRVCGMTLPPGSTFKVVTAVALLESAALDPEKRFFCQGYLHEPDRQRCQIYVRQGVGHGEVALADALSVSCNVYFFHFAGQMGPRPLVDWAERFGFGRPTGVDLPTEAAGSLPSPENVRQLDRRAWRTADTQLMAIGQGSLTATPLQVVRMMAAVANGGRLVVPHVVERDRGAEARGQGSEFRGQVRVGTPVPSPGSEIPLSPRTLRVVRDGLRRVVADAKGTAHATVYLESIAIAGKTGTAEAGEDRASHAWLAGYVPADDPKLALVVVLEHAGDAATAAGPLVKRLVLRMDQLGML